MWAHHLIIFLSSQFIYCAKLSFLNVKFEQHLFISYYCWLKQWLKEENKGGWSKSWFSFFHFLIIFIPFWLYCFTYPVDLASAFTVLVFNSLNDTVPVLWVWKPRPVHCQANKYNVFLSLVSDFTWLCSWSWVSHLDLTCTCSGDLFETVPGLAKAAINDKIYIDFWWALPYDNNLNWILPVHTRLANF